MTIDEMIEVLKAAKRGEIIEFRDAYNSWRVCNPPVPKEFLFYATNEYRVKPKPREWWAEVPRDGQVGQLFTDGRQVTVGGELIRVREVLE
jgi:hypothetical protein